MEISIALLVVYIILSFAVLGLWISALISAASTAKNKVLWVLIVFVFGGIGALAWFLFGERGQEEGLLRPRAGNSAAAPAPARQLRPAPRRAPRHQTLRPAPVTRGRRCGTGGRAMLMG
ncbi:MAG: PLDc_N domain-containing protein [Planctomycetota bacterium]|nr:PLDc_N domain-containing protein [Planctomycetota bacterium]